MNQPVQTRVNGKQILLSGWTPAFHTFSSNLAVFNPENIDTAGENLTLLLNRKRYGNKPYSGAEIRSAKRYSSGTFETRMKVAKGSGIVSAFFLYGPDANKEIDVEITGNNTSVLHLNHWVSSKSNGVEIPLGFNAAEDFHTYTITWKRGLIVWHVDGKEVHRTSNDVPAGKLHLVYNLWASATESFAGKFDPAALPAKMEIAYLSIQ